MVNFFEIIHENDPIQRQQNIRRVSRNAKNLKSLIQCHGKRIGASNYL